MNKILRSFLTFLFLLFASLSFAQSNVLKGVVTDDTGEGLPGVTITIKGTLQGTTTHFNGNYNISVPDEAVLVYSFIGFQSQEIEFSGQSTIDVSLRVEVSELDEVVVVGYGTQKKSDITGATGTVSAKDVDMQPIGRVENMMQGRVAGVVVAQNSGAPGSAPKVNIRGFTGNPVYVIDGFIGGDINTVNPNDIESISVLKDASATAIYGSQGANGVILVTTKAGGKNKPYSINVDYQHTVSDLHTTLDLMDPISYMKIVNKKLQEGGANPIFSNEYIQEAEGTSGFGTDWQDVIFRTAHSDKLDLALTKGWDNVSSRFSIGARKDDGIVKNSDYERFTSRLNLNGSISKTTLWTANLAYARENTHNLYEGGARSDGQNSAVAAATAWSPNLAVYDKATNDYTGFQGYGATVRRNPAFLINEVDRRSANNNINAQVNLSQEFTDDFTFKITAATQRRYTDGSTFTRYDPVAQTTPDEQKVSSLNTTERIYYRHQGNAQLDYSKLIGDDHDLKVTGVFEVLKQRDKREVFVTNIPFNSVPEQRVRQGIYESTPVTATSFLGRVNYDFRDKILFTGSIRFDGSSKLPANNRWDYFPSAALAYRVSEEPFLNRSNTISNLKIRAGYGVIGNVNSLDATTVLDLTDNAGGYIFDGTQFTNAAGVEQGGDRANPFLQWELSRQFNAGVDLALWDGQLEFIADYYVKYTEQMHFSERVPRYMGGGSVTTNSGTFQNSGIELMAIHQYSNGKSLNIKSSFNFTFNLSEVIKMPLDTLHVGSSSDGFDQQSHVLIVGQRVGQLWGYRYLGAKTSDTEMLPGEVAGLQPGDAIYKDRNGDGQISIDDMTVLGNGHPDYTWGFNTAVDYKNFTITAFIQGMHGVDVYNIPQHGLLGGGAGVLDATSTDIYNSWSISENGNLPSLNANYRVQSSLFVEDASFVRVKNITVGYNLPQAIKDRLRLKTLRVYGGVQNPFTITNYKGYDPEARSGGNTTPGMDRGSFPIPRVYTLGLNFGF